jgi:hypothetical protein
VTRLPTLLTGAVGVVVASGAVATAVGPHNGALASSGQTPPPSPHSGAVVSASHKAPVPLRGRRQALASARQLVSRADDRLRSAAADLRKAKRRHRGVAPASTVLATAERQRHEAHLVMRQIRQPRATGGPGAARFARQCARAGVIAGVCRPVPWREDHLVLDSVVISRVVNAKWPSVRKMWGWRPYDAYPDHPAGRAVDIMIPSDARGYDTALGNEIARYFQRHAERHGIYYILWRQRMWLAGNGLDAWSPMSNRGSDTANHMDHVHISVRGGQGQGLRELIRQLAS